MKLKFTSLLLFICSFLFSQNYQLISSKGYKLFQIQSEAGFVVKALRVDSVVLNGLDSIFYFNHELERVEDTYSAVYANGNSFLGKCITIKNDGFNNLVNQKKDTLKFKTNATLGETWVFYQRNDSVLKAKVSAIDQENFLGVSDSVKTFSLKLEVNGLVQNSLFDTLNFKISKKYGVLSIINLNYFHEPPASEYHYIYGYNDPNSIVQVNYLKKHELIGQSNPKIGTQNLTKKDLHNFNVGDEFHYKGSYNFGLECLCTYTTNSKYIYRILDKYNVSDTIVYKVEFTSHDEGHYKDSIWNKFNIDTMYDKIYSDSQFDELPFIPYFDTMSNLLHINKMSSLSEKEVRCLGYRPELDYYREPIGNVIKVCEAYHPKIYNPNPTGYVFFPDYGSTALVYSKSGEEEWGTPLRLIESSNEILTEEILSVYPNPSNSVFNFSFKNEGNYEISIFALNGAHIFNSNCHESKLLVDLSSFSKGIYQYAVKGGKFPVHGKLIVQ